jgi:hypothetical protein
LYQEGAMHLYAPGTPSNDVFTLLENQHCTHRLVSMHEDYAAVVMAWLGHIKVGIRTVNDLLRNNVILLRYLDHADAAVRARLDLTAECHSLAKIRRYVLPKTRGRNDRIGGPSTLLSADGALFYEGRGST